jgi:hypothetical protein
MRDYFVFPAQTNLELYAQAIGHGYGRQQRRTLADAYQLAHRQVFRLARGSGKPFIAHLVGTASLVMESRRPDDWVIGALLHALYQRRVPFEGGHSPEQRRGVISNRFGRVVDDLVDRYTAFESEDLSRPPTEFAASDDDVLTLRLADELEDLTGFALALHGSDDPTVRGSYAWRRDVKAREAPALLNLAQFLGLDGIGRGLVHWLDTSAVPPGLEDMRTGWFSSVDLLERPLDEIGGGFRRTEGP